MARRAMARDPLPPLPELASVLARAADLLSIRGLAAIRDVTIRLENPLVIVGEDGVPIEPLLRAIRCLVDPRARLVPADFRDPSRPIEMVLTDPSGAHLLVLRAVRTRDGVRTRRSRGPLDPGGHVVFFSAARRGGLNVADVAGRLGIDKRMTAMGAGTQRDGPPHLLQLCEVCLDCDLRSAWILIEAPEIHVGPHAQRALASLLRALAGCGNRVIYTTHSPNLIDARHTDGIVRLVHGRRGALGVAQAPHTPPGDVPDLVRRLASFDRERNGMFFARRVLVVEGASERLSLPFAFRLLGYDPDVEGVAIVDAGGKGNLTFIARTLRELAIPTVVLHDRDAPADGAPSHEDWLLNRAITRAAGRRSVVLMTPDFEGVSGLPAHVRHKPSQAWLHYSSIADPAALPAAVTDAIERLMRR